MTAGPLDWQVEDRSLESKPDRFAGDCTLSCRWPASGRLAMGARSAE